MWNCVSRPSRVGFCEIKSKCVSCGLEKAKKEQKQEWEEAKAEAEAVEAEAVEAAAVNENLSGRQRRSGGFMHGLDKCFMLRLARLVSAYYAKVPSVHAAYA